MAPLHVCANCARVLRCEKNDVYVIEMADFGPYKVWYADLWKCPKCDHKFITGFGLECVSEHYEDDFPKWLERALASGYHYYCYWQY